MNKRLVGAIAVGVSIMAAYAFGVPLVQETWDNTDNVEGWEIGFEPGDTAGGYGDLSRDADLGGPNGAVGALRIEADGDTQPQIEEMKKKLLGKRPKSNASKYLGRYAHIPAAAYLRFKDIARPDHVDNPFRKGKSDEVRKRNHLMVELAYQLGLRAGEILGLWVEDIEYGPKPTLYVRRRHNHPLDPRKHQAVAKTKERPLPLPPELASSLNDYILNYRSRHTNANCHPILFVASQAPWNGHPLSYTSFSDTFDSVSQVDPDRLKDISPHALRHDRACRFVDKLEQINQAAKTNKKIKAITDGEVERALMDYFGWANSRSADVYLQRRTRAKIDEAMETFRKSAFT